MARKQAPWSSLALAHTALWLLACSASTTPGSAPRGNAGAPPGSETAGSASVPLGSAGTTTLIVGLPSSGGSGGSDGMDSCATQKANAAIVREPVDIILTIDNSGSMQDEIDAVAKSINQNFATVLQTSGVDYRVILLSRHAKKGRATSICVLAPLGGTTVCPPTPDQPAFTDRFYQYSLKVDSTNSLVLLLGTYDGSTPDEFKLAPMGWSAWLRPTAKKVFLEITDDNSADMSSADFDAKLLALSPDNFGTAAHRKYTFHSIIGIGEKPKATDAWQPSEDIQMSLCTGNGDTVENPGVVYQELSKLTGGLRFPICQFTAFDTVFQTIANDVVSHAGIACEFDIPPPPADSTLDLSKVAVSYDPGDGSGAKTYGQAMTAAECQPDAFYIDTATNKIELCPDTCAAAQNGVNPNIDVLFTCAPTYVVPR